MADQVIFLTTTGAGTWTVPADWNSAANKIEGLGAGAGGRVAVTSVTFGTAGGSGAYAAISNIALTPGATVFINVGTGGATGTAGTDTWWNAVSNAAPTLASQGILAKAGLASSGTNNTTGGLGGPAANCVGNTVFSGGPGGNGSGTSNQGSGSGGAAGPSGAGGAGGAVSAPSTGGNGGTANNGSPAGGAGGASGIAGTAGTAAAIWTQTSNGATAGPGSGSGGGGSTASGANGALYGAGGSGAGVGATAGLGAQGIIIITYTPIVISQPNFGIIIG